VHRGRTTAAVGPNTRAESRCTGGVPLQLWDLTQGQRAGAPGRAHCSCAGQQGLPLLRMEHRPLHSQGRRYQERSRASEMQACIPEVMSTRMNAHQMLLVEVAVLVRTLQKLRSCSSMHAPHSQSKQRHDAHLVHACSAQLRNDFSLRFVSRIPILFAPRRHLILSMNPLSACGPPLISCVHLQCQQNTGTPPRAQPCLSVFTSGCLLGVHILKT